jgi:hypothetical protein
MARARLAQEKVLEGLGSGVTRAKTQMRAAHEVCVGTFSKDTANYMPRSGPINASARYVTLVITSVTYRSCINRIACNCGIDSQQLKRAKN